ncbi:MAG: RloB family protein [Treponema sp.]|nr:RloB family protein [Treponema sp.]
MGKSIKYELGYSNIDFELWIILHKKDLFGSVGSKSQYLKNINQIFGTKYEGLKEYKEEKNFKQILSQITLEDAKVAYCKGRENN